EWNDVDAVVEAAEVCGEVLGMDGESQRVTRLVVDVVVAQHHSGAVVAHRAQDSDGKTASLLDDEHQLVTLGGLQHTPRVALLLSGDVLEDRLQPIRWSVDQFCARIPTTADLAVIEALTAQQVDVLIVSTSLAATHTE